MRINELANTPLPDAVLALGLHYNWSTPNRTREMLTLYMDGDTYRDLMLRFGKTTLSSFDIQVYMRGSEGSVTPRIDSIYRSRFGAQIMATA